MIRRAVIAFILLGIIGLALTSNVQGQAPVQDPPNAADTFDLEETVASSMPLQIIVLLTVLSFIPAMLISMTCFTRLIVVFHFLRQALGTQEAAQQSGAYRTFYLHNIVRNGSFVDRGL